MSVTVRRATMADVDLLVDFNLQMAAETEDRGLDAARLRRGIERSVEQPERARYLMAERDGEVAGTMMLTREWSEWRDGWFWWIQSVYVDARHRRRGVYQALHAHVRNQALTEADVIGIRLYVEHDNVGAQQTYERLGMVRTGYYLYEEDFVSGGG